MTDTKEPSARELADLVRGTSPYGWWVDARDQIAAALDRAAQQDACSTCGGSPPESGLPCVCGGVNTRDAEVHGLRLAAIRAEERVAQQDARIAELERERDEAREMLVLSASMLDRSRHDILRALGETDMGKGWFVTTGLVSEQRARIARLEAAIRANAGDAAWAKEALSDDAG